MFTPTWSTNIYCMSSICKSSYIFSLKPKRHILVPLKCVFVCVYILYTCIFWMCVCVCVCMPPPPIWELLPWQSSFLHATIVFWRLYCGLWCVNCLFLYPPPLTGSIVLKLQFALEWQREFINNADSQVPFPEILILFRAGPDYFHFK